jgi:hypothetical protein
MVLHSGQASASEDEETMRMELRVLGGIAAAFFAFSAPALAVDQPAPKGPPVKAVCDQSLRSIANTSHARMSPCIVRRGQMVIETMYYQNASSEGGTALAAYPEATFRIGLSPRLELFVDAPSDVAKSGTHGEGVFYLTHPGFGAKALLSSSSTFASSLSVETSPQLHALAHLSLIPVADATLTGSWMLRRSKIVLTVQAGAFLFRQRGMEREQRTAATFAVGITAPVMKKTWLNLQLNSISAAAMHSSAQSTGTLSVQHEIGRNVLANLQLGTAFNAAGHSKAHYLGFGFTIRR